MYRHGSNFPAIDLDSSRLPPEHLEQSFSIPSDSYLFTDHVLENEDMLRMDSLKRSRFFFQKKNVHFEINSKIFCFEGNDFLDSNFQFFIAHLHQFPFE